jgi:hypothetical protein
MTRTQTKTWACAALLALASCGNDDATMVSNMPSGSGGTDVGTGNGNGNGGSSAETDPPPCVENPVTHLEIINACTSAVGVRKSPELTLLNPDGSLPPP